MFDFLLNQLHPAWLGTIAGVLSGFGIFAAVYKGRKAESAAGAAGDGQSQSAAAGEKRSQSDVEGQKQSQSAATGRNRFKVFNVFGWVIAVGSMVFYLVLGVIIPYLGEVTGKHTIGLILYALVMLFVAFVLQRLFGPRKPSGSGAFGTRVSMRELMVMAHNRRNGGVYLLAEREIDGKVVRLYSDNELFEVDAERGEIQIPDSPEKDAIVEKVRETIK